MPLISINITLPVPGIEPGAFRILDTIALTTPPGDFNKIEKKQIIHSSTSNKMALIVAKVMVMMLRLRYCVNATDIYMKIYK